jgi:hypothetical protein
MPPVDSMPAVRASAESVEASTRSAARAAPGRRPPTYVEAYADARGELDDDLAYVGFGQLFVTRRLLATDGPHTARRIVAAAGNIVRVYRGREVMLEQSYRPGDPDPTGSLRETFEAAEAARSILADCDSLFGILEAQQGRYALERGTLRFQNPEAGAAYAALQGQIAGALGVWGDSAASRTQVVMPRILRAFSPPPPPGR